VEEGAVRSFPFYMDYNKALLEEFMSKAVILVDNREKVNDHIINYFKKNKIEYKIAYMETGDYAITLNMDGETMKSALHIVIERKNSIDELVGSFKYRQRFANEFMRAKKSNTRMILLVEDPNGYENIIKGNYRSEYLPKALMNSLKAFETRFNFQTVFLNKKYSGQYIYDTLSFYLREAVLCSAKTSSS
jgi:ERCC4-type nuclease